MKRLSHRDISVLADAAYALLHGAECAERQLGKERRRRAIELTDEQLQAGAPLSAREAADQQLDDLAAHLLPSLETFLRRILPFYSLEQIQDFAIAGAIIELGGRKQAAAALGVSRRTLYNRVSTQTLIGANPRRPRLSAAAPPKERR